jgi:hypothetical protein
MVAWVHAWGSLQVLFKTVNKEEDGYCSDLRVASLSVGKGGWGRVAAARQRGFLVQPVSPVSGSIRQPRMHAATGIQ